MEGREYRSWKAKKMKVGKKVYAGEKGMKSEKKCKEDLKMAPARLNINFHRYQYSTVSV